MDQRPKKKTILRRSRLVLGDAFGHFNDDDGWAMSSHVALSALMAVFPFLIFVASLAGFIGRQALADRVADILFATWPEDVAGPISAEVHRVLTEPRGSLLTVSILVTVYLASNGVEAVRTALNRAYRVTENRHLLRRRAQSVFFVIIGAVASLGIAFLGLLGPLFIGRITGIVPVLEPLTSVFTFSRFLVTGLVLITVLIAAHLWLPAGRPHALSLWPGILMTMVLWILAATIFGAYIDRFANYVATYAGLAGVVAALFFLYLIAVAMIFGAEFNAAIARLKEGKLG
jgi:membrane protein